MNNPKRIVVHCSASENFKPLDISEIDMWHKARGWKKVGYHRVIQPNGQVQIGRYYDEEGAHCPEANSDSISICLIGTDRYTKAQFDSLYKLIAEVKALYNLNFNDIYCHHEFESAKKQGKTCPGIRAADLCVWYLRNDPNIIEKYMEVS